MDFDLAFTDFSVVQPVHVLVVGGGAAGFFGAIACAEAYSHVRVTLLEAGPTPLTKVRISGGGRCNVTHACFEPAQLVQHYPRGGRALRGAFTRFQPRDTVAWFQRQGVSLKTEADGRMFPVSDDSETIVRCLTQAANRTGVVVRTSAPVTAIRHINGRFDVQLKTRESLQSDRLLLATGSSAVGYRLANRLGHTILPPVPSLFTMTIPETGLRELAGIAVEGAQVRLRVADHKPFEQTGPLLITHWGMSGPAILKLSAWGARALHDHHYRAELVVNWVPHLTIDQVRQQLLTTKQAAAKRAIASFCPLPLPRRLWHYLVARAQIDSTHRWADLSRTNLHHLTQELTQSLYRVKGKGVFKDEFVTCGGVSLSEVNFKTMESRLCPGLHFAGEVLDIDGVTGGFNFQSAWTTGWLAGQAMGTAPHQHTSL